MGMPSAVSMLVCTNLVPQLVNRASDFSSVLISEVAAIFFDSCYSQTDFNLHSEAS